MEPYQRLELEFARRFSRDHAVSVNTGTAALHLAVAALGIGPGDEVIVPDFTMYACALAVHYVGAKPVFVDCRSDMNIDPGKIRLAITSRTKAIMPVHIYGRMCDMDPILRLAQEHGLFVIEDASEAHGASYKTRPAGSFGTVSCFSLYRNKIVHAEEGGICLTNLDWLATRMQDMKNMAFGTRHDYLHTGLGFNYRMTNSQANLALESLSKIAANVEKRRQIAEWYDELLPGMEKIPRPNGSVIWVYDFLCGAYFQQKIIDAVPGARHFFKPMSMQPLFSAAEIGRKSFSFAGSGVYLPVREDMERHEVEDISRRVVASLSM